jgi:hypothetical protein
MQNLFGLIFFISLVLSIVGISKPSIIKQKSRLKGFLYPLAISFFSLAMVGVFAPQSANKDMSKTAIEKNITTKMIEQKVVLEKNTTKIEVKTETPKMVEKKSNLSTNKRIEVFLEDRGNFRNIKVTSNPTTLSLTSLGIQNDLQEVTQDLIYRGFFYGAFWSFVADNDLKRIKIKVYLKDMNSHKIFKKSTIVISRIAFMYLLNSINFVSNDIKDFIVIDEYNSMQMSGVARQTYTHSKALESAISVLSKMN